MPDTLTDVYLDHYKRLEEAARHAYGLQDGESVMNYLKQNRRFTHYAEQLDYCREVRNFLSHNPKVDGEFAVVPSQSMIDFIDELTDTIAGRQRCFSIATTGNALERRRLGDRVRDAMETMRAKQFSYLPIVDDKRVIGVFDERSMFNYLAENGIVEIDSELRFSDLFDYCSLERTDTEVFAFCARDMYVDELVAEFEKWFGQGKRLCAAFLTEHGKAEEALLGIVTAWDVLGKGNV